MGNIYKLNVYIDNIEVLRLNLELIFVGTYDHGNQPQVRLILYIKKFQDFTEGTIFN